MSGGIAYVYDDQGDFGARRCNQASVDLEPLVASADVTLVRGLLERHRDLTGSPRAAWILEHWADAQPKFIKVFPHEYKRVLGVARATAQSEAYASPVVASPPVATSGLTVTSAEVHPWVRTLDSWSFSASSPPAARLTSASTTGLKSTSRFPRRSSASRARAAWIAVFLLPHRSAR